jgi:YesN/AraC family two-component response regulator
MLEGSKKSLEQITQEVGYNDMSSFIRLFKKHTSMSPGAFRVRFSRRPEVPS